MEKKYKFTGKHITVKNGNGDSVMVYETIAIKSFTTRQGAKVIANETKGAWVEKDNLVSHYGLAWADAKTVICDYAQVVDDAYVVNSSLKNTSLVHKQAVVIDSFLKDNAKVKDRAKVRSSELKGKTIISGYSNVVDSELENLIMYSDEETEPMNTCNLSSVLVFGKSVYLFADCTWSDTKISGNTKKLLFIASSTLNNVNIEAVNQFEVFHKVILSNVRFAPNSYILFTDDYKCFSTINGLKRKRFKTISIKGSYEFSDVEITGNVQLKGGEWFITQSTLADEVILNHDDNEGKHRITECIIRDFAIIDLKWHPNLVDIKGLKLDGDFVLT